MASKKLLLTLFSITGLLILCYAYVGNTGRISYREGVSSANGVLSLGKRILGSGKGLNNVYNLTSRKPKLDWKEYWRHVEERKIMGFQEEVNNVLEEVEEVAPKEDINVITDKKVVEELAVKEDINEMTAKELTDKAVKEVTKVVAHPVEPNTVIDISRPNKKSQSTVKKVSNKKWLYDWNETKDTVSSLPLYGNWQNELAQRIIFNRVGKCGSRSVLDVFKHLAKQNQYNMINSIVYNQTRISEEKKNLIVSVLMKVDPPFLFQRHMHYVDFSKFSSSSVKYINIIRDPIDRFTSQYYFRRFGDGKNEKSNRRFKGTEEEKYQTINECVLHKKPECSVKKLQYIIPFFCGHSPQCRFLDRTPLEMAKINVERDFIVVGVLDELEDTFAVLEKMLPRFFTGAIEYLRVPGNSYAHNRSATVTKHKESPSEEVRAILLEQMSLEYEFFYYIRDRFHKLKIQLGIGQHIQQQ